MLLTGDAAPITECCQRSRKELLFCVVNVKKYLPVKWSRKSLRNDFRDAAK
jgi:hypothetical protein